MPHTHTETVGIIEGVIAHLKDTDNAAALTTAGFPVATRVARLQGKLDAITSASAEQKKRKVAEEQQTVIYNASLEDGYTDASGAIDSIGDAYGKGSMAAKNVQKIRSAIRTGPRPPKTTAPKP